MGLLNFWKKKDTGLPEFSAPTQPLLNEPLPSLNLPEESNNSATPVSLDELRLDSMQLPELDIPSEFLSDPGFNNTVPEPLSVPKTSPSIVSQVSDQKSASLSASLNSQLIPSNLNPNVSNQSNDVVVKTPEPLLNADDLNHLFISDDWKDPDWNNFEPYTEDKIDEPVSEDFKGSELPQFEDVQDTSTGYMTSDDSVLEPKDPYAQNSKSDHIIGEPLELYIRGKAYARAFIELEQMNKALLHIDSKTGLCSELIKKEEPLLIIAKDQMEYVYKKLNYVDKKIFTN